MSKHFILIIFSLFLISSVSAQTVPTSTVKNRVLDIRQNTKQGIIIDTRQNIIQEIKQKKVETVEQIKQKRDEFKNAIEQKRMEFKNQIETKGVELKNVIEAKRQELKERLKIVKDERKKEAVERIDNRMDALNEGMINHFSEVLERLEKILSNIGSRADKAAVSGIDVSAVRAAITNAQSAISASRQAIATQAGKTYKIAITTETGLRQDVGKARQELHDNLVKVRDAIFASREAVKKAAITLAQIPKINEIEVDLNQPATSTVSGTTTGTEQ
ncbi:MAG: hypothetical protein AAB405_00570 [Patescibacteria group bacterium]